MPRLQRPRKDYSKQSGNPTNAIEKAYPKLMQIVDLGEFQNAVLSLIQPLVGSGMSEQNYKKFLSMLEKASDRKGIDGAKSFVTNYILAGSGLQVESCQINAIASLLNEHISLRLPLTQRQYELKILVEGHTNYSVGLVTESI